MSLSPIRAHAPYRGAGGREIVCERTHSVGGIGRGRRAAKVIWRKFEDYREMDGDWWLIVAGWACQLLLLHFVDPSMASINTAINTHDILNVRFILLSPFNSLTASSSQSFDQQAIHQNTPQHGCEIRFVCMGTIHFILYFDVGISSGQRGILCRLPFTGYLGSSDGNG